jgi:hypothetical protein
MEAATAERDGQRPVDATYHLSSDQISGCVAYFTDNLPVLGDIAVAALPCRFVVNPLRTPAILPQIAHGDRLSRQTRL